MRGFSEPEWRRWSGCFLRRDIVTYNSVDLGRCDMFAPCTAPCVCTMTFNQAVTAGSAITIFFGETSGAEQNGLTSVTIS